MSQEKAIELINSGENVFITGPGGVGKSHIINEINNNQSVLVAPTGIAALNIGGDTCHSVFNLPFGLVTEKDKEQSSRNCFEIFSDDTVNRLIIDEVSMLRADYIDLINYRLQRIKNNFLPFGGIQTIVVGDYYQLSPIVSGDERKYFKDMYSSPYAFSSEVWDEAEFVPIVLSKIYRQSDAEQIKVLNSIRTKDKYWKDAIVQLNDWCEEQEDISQLTLCNYKVDANMINQIFYKQLKSKEKQYIAEIKGDFKEKDCKVDKIIKLKPETRIILCANDREKTFKNGQTAIVKELEDDVIHATLEDSGIDIQIEKHKWESTKYSKKLMDNGNGKLKNTLVKEVKGSFKQFPVRIGWGITVHKAQGLTLDNCAVNLGAKSFAAHQTYVAFSRIRNLKNMTLTRPVEFSDILVDPKVKKFYEGLGND